MKKHMKIISSFLLCLILLTGCGGVSTRGTSPIISNLAFNPSSATLNQGGGIIAVTGIIDFVDMDGDLFAYTLTSAAGSSTGSIAGATGMTRGSITLTINVLTNFSRVLQFQVYVTDSAGNNSNMLFGTFVVQ